MRNTKYFITGGGTGGHIYPAIAVISELVKSGADRENIFYLGSKKNLEYQITQKEGLKFLSYDVSGMPRKISFKLVSFFIKLFTATLIAMYYTLKYKPDVVFATGGYVCAPILICAKIFKIPYVLHDCDAHPGIVSRLFSSGAKAVSVAFESAKEYTKCKDVFCFGNPIREDFKTLSKDEARAALGIKRDFVILIMGGSLGAKKINDSAKAIVQKYADSKDVEIIWQTGKKNYNEVLSQFQKSPENLPKNIILRPYFDNMALALTASDIAVSRAGSLSLSELCAAGLASVLVPYPHAAADHQRINAKKMCELGAAVYLDDDDCSGESLLSAVEEYILNKDKLLGASKCAKANAKYDGAKNIAELINWAAEGR